MRYVRWYRIRWTHPHLERNGTLAKLTNTYTEVALSFLLESATDALRIKTRELIVFHNTMTDPANGNDMTVGQTKKTLVQVGQQIKRTYLKALQNKGWDVTASELELNNLICVIKKHNKKPDPKTVILDGPLPLMYNKLLDTID